MIHPSLHCCPRPDDPLPTSPLATAHTRLQVDARVLPQPALAYGRPSALDVGVRGAWNLRNAAFVRGAELNCWAVLSLVPQQRVDVQVGAGCSSRGRGRERGVSACAACRWGALQLLGRGGAARGLVGVQQVVPAASLRMLLVG